MTSASHGTRAPAALAVAVAVAACATAARPPPSRGDDERRMNLEVTRELLGFDHSLQIRESRTGVPHELRDGDTLREGDRIRVHVQTSADAYLYLVYCSKQGVTLYPPQGVIRVPAGVVTALPTGGAELVVDHEPGTEVLYVVASTAELAAADPKLAAALTTKTLDRTAQDCGPSLDAAFGAISGATSGATSAASPPPAPAARPSTPSARPAARTPRTIRGKSVAKRPLLSPAQPRTPLPPPPPDPDFVRNLVDDTRAPAAAPSGGAAPRVTAADGAGIAVVRHEFIHVAR